MTSRILFLSALLNFVSCQEQTPSHAEENLASEPVLIVEKDYGDKALVVSEQLTQEENGQPTSLACSLYSKNDQGIISKTSHLASGETEPTTEIRKFHNRRFEISYEHPENGTVQTSFLSNEIEVNGNPLSRRVRSVEEIYFDEEMLVLAISTDLFEQGDAQLLENYELRLPLNATAPYEAVRI